LEKLLSLQSNYDGDSCLTHFSSLLGGGSALGIYFVCEIHRASVMRKLSYDAMSFFEHRIAYFMNDDDSMVMMNSSKANKLIDADNFNCRSKAYYYSQSNQITMKFKSYVHLCRCSKLIYDGFSLNESIVLRDIDLTHTESGMEELTNSSEDAERMSFELRLKNIERMAAEVKTIPVDLLSSFEDLMNEGNNADEKK
jgi:hypothetical protein